MLTVVTWKWGRAPFTAEHANKMRSMLARNLGIPHCILCFTDDTRGIDSRVECLPLPTEFAGSFRCRRRMWHYRHDLADLFGPRFLSVDLDNILTGVITPLVERTEPLVMFRVGYANVLSGSFVLCDTGYLHGAYAAYAAEPLDYPARISKNASDQAMLNHYLRGRQVAQWKERDGFCVFFGDGYEALEHHGVGPNRPTLPKGTRVLVLGSADLWALKDPRFEWRRHWC